MSYERKILNMNAFNEKLIHRYFLETLYFDGKHRKNLLPYSLQKKIPYLNLIVPEDTLLYQNYRADFTLYFKDDREGIPVEIKWTSKEFNKDNQIKSLKRKGGFLVTFDDPLRNDIEHVKIDNDHFRSWIIKRIESLWDDAISAKLKKSLQQKSWIVVLRGQKALQNYIRMRKMCQNSKNFWAFKNEKVAIQNILNIGVGDQLIFLFVRDLDGYNKMIPESNNRLGLNRVYYSQIVSPYYMVLKGKKATFFEKKHFLEINKRKWTHFIDFKIIQQYRFKNEKYLLRKDFPKELKIKIASSANRGGIPIELSHSETDFLRGQIRLLTELKSLK